MLTLDETTAILDLPYEQIAGLRPQFWVIVGSGYSREELKSLVLSQGKGFIAEALSTVQELCLKILNEPAQKVLSPFAREEVLRLLLSDSRISGELHELKKFKRQRDLMKRLDLAIQSGRLCFAHSQEEEVYEERLSQVLGSSALRKEVSALARAYEAWMKASGWYDLPLLLQEAIAQIQSSAPQQLVLPEEVLVLSVSSPESLEREFWDALNRWVKVVRVESSREGLYSRVSDEKSSFEWEKWHTLDDAIESFADRVLKFWREDRSRVWKDYALLIPDHPEIRRSLKRSFQERNLPFAESRDPTLLKWDEKYKWAILPLQVVARNFERSRVLSWLRSHYGAEKFIKWSKEIHYRGIRFGLKSYLGGELESVHEILNELNQKWGGRQTCRAIAQAHIEFLGAQLKIQSLPLSLIQSFETLWKNLCDDLERVGQSEKKAPLLYWLDRLEYRLSSASPPVEPLKPREGLRVYRLQQAPLIRANHVFILALPSRWLSSDRVSDYWFSEREREILSSEFAVRSSVSFREEKLRVLMAWMSQAQRITILDSEFDVAGKERENILPIVRELELAGNFQSRAQAVHCGAHTRFLPSFDVLRPSQPTQVELSSFHEFMAQAHVSLSASLIDRTSRCTLQSMALYRWKLSDLKEPDTELWPEVKGNILHEAVRLLKRSVGPNHEFEMNPQDALYQAWKKKQPQGLIKSQRVERYIQSRLVHVLNVFCEKEIEYMQRSETHCLSLDDQRLALHYPGFTLIGTPDRIDQHADGIFIMDYKSSGVMPHGSEMLDYGYRLQLPVYALAAQKALNQQVIGAQFIELDRRGGRKSGIHFKKFNGKEKGKISVLRSNSKSLLDSDPQKVWQSLEQKILNTAEQFIQGKFQAQPNSNHPHRECAQCMVSDLCGLRRRVDRSSEEG